MSSKKYGSTPTPRNIVQWMDDTWEKWGKRLEVSITAAPSRHHGELLVIAAVMDPFNETRGGLYEWRQKYIRNGQGQDLWAIIYGLVVEVNSAYERAREADKRDSGEQLPF